MAIQERHRGSQEGPMVSKRFNSTTGMQMTLYEGMIVANLAVTAFLAYRYGKMSEEIKMLFEGVAMTMDKLGMTED